MPRKEAKKRRASLPVFRQDVVEEDALQHLWAVSYSDLLMVLMCFFILFFQQSDPKTLDRLILSIKDRTAPVPTSRSAEQQRETASAPGIEVIEAALKASSLPVQARRQGETLFIDLDQDLYRPGAYAFPREREEELSSLLRKMSPYADEIQLTFVGHADERAIRRKDKIIDSNLVLSNLRATRAAEFALRQGFDPKFVTAEGAGEFSRNTRSLSLKITERR